MNKSQPVRVSALVVAFVACGSDVPVGIERGAQDAAPGGAGGTAATTEDGSATAGHAVADDAAANGSEPDAGPTCAPIPCPSESFWLPGVCRCEPFDGLRAHWTFDEDDGALVLDRSGNGVDALVVSGSALDAPASPNPRRVPGVRGRAIDLAGSTDWVRVASAALDRVMPTEGFGSVSAWVRTHSTSANWDPIVTFKIGDWSSGFGLLFNHPAVMKGPAAVPSDSFAVIERWQHLAISDAGGYASLWVDGERVSTLNAQYPLSKRGEPLLIGASFHAAFEHFDGAIDEVRIYDHPLTAPEVRALASAP
jgi:hypothetical protein